MTKTVFLEKVRSGISSLSENDIKRWIDYYSEMIDDRIEDGISEEDAVAAMGSVDDVISHILRDENAEPTNINNAEPNKKDKNLFDTIKDFINRHVTDENRIWVILVVVLAVPIWVPVLTSLFGAIVSVVVSLFSVVVGIYAGAVALVAAFVGCVVKGIAVLSVGALLGSAMMYFGIGFICLGIGILMFLLANLCARLIIKGIKFVCSYVKSKIQKKEERV